MREIDESIKQFAEEKLSKLTKKEIGNKEYKKQKSSYIVLVCFSILSLLYTITCITAIILFNEKDQIISQLILSIIFNTIILLATIKLKKEISKLKTNEEWAKQKIIKEILEEKDEEEKKRKVRIYTNRRKKYLQRNNNRLLY